MGSLARVGVGVGAAGRSDLDGAADTGGCSEPPAAGDDASGVGRPDLSGVRVGLPEATGERDALGAGAVTDALSDREGDASERLGEAGPLHDDSSAQRVSAPISEEREAALGRRRAPDREPAPMVPSFSHHDARDL